VHNLCAASFPSPSFVSKTPKADHVGATMKAPMDPRVLGDMDEGRQGKSNSRKNVTECYGRLEKLQELSSFCSQRPSQNRVRFALRSHSIEYISPSSVDIRVLPMNIVCNHGSHEPEGLGLALAHRCTRLRAGFVVRTKTESKRAAGVKPAAFSFLE